MPHIHDKIDFTVEVFIVYNNKVLLRKHDKYKIWLSIGGHIELEDDPNEAAIREVKEEVGLDIELYSPIDIPNPSDKNYKELIPPFYLNRHRINDNHEHVTLVYFAKSNSDKLKLSDKEITEDCKWFSKEELDNEELKDNVRFYANEALKALSKDL
ncbi:NUDIX domain-containing protein [Candidatus Woesearchaeota archaeon]|nr:NUDIX domain-containing protein [Candidatus Woesearchaeota archaeon]